jgi:hypothetical protein
VSYNARNIVPMSKYTFKFVVVNVVLLPKYY